jgi:ketopantoate reductase
MRVLIVGAGAVGRVLGRSLEASKTNEVTYYVRAGRKAALAQLKLLDGKTGELHVRERPAAVEPSDPLPHVDTVVLAVRGDQLDEALTVVDRLPGDARIASAAATLDGLERLRARFAGRPAVEVVPLFLAYPEGDVLRWWNPPLARTLVTWERDPGARAFAEELAGALDDGGLPARAVGSIAVAHDALLAAGMPLVASWELAGWNLDGLARDGELRRLAARGLSDAVGALGGGRGVVAASLLGRAAEPLVAALLRAAPYLIPRDAQQMWRVHGPKIAGQTRALIDRLVARGGGARGLVELRRRLDEHGPR